MRPRTVGSRLLEERLLGCRDLSRSLVERGQLGSRSLGFVAPRTPEGLIPRKSECAGSPAKGGGRGSSFPVASDLR